jgi:uncharacterized damage-inducible protein DinB
VCGLPRHVTWYASAPAGPAQTLLAVWAEAVNVWPQFNLHPSPPRDEPNWTDGTKEDNPRASRFTILRVPSDDKGCGEHVDKAGPPTRRFAWSNMFVRPEDDPRADGGFHGERATLVGYLCDYRLTLELKCQDLDAAGMARRSVEPSNLSLLGLVRHLADVERHWFRRVLGGQDVAWLYRREDDRDAAFNGAVAEPEAVAAAWAAWRDQVKFSERFVDAAPDLELTGTSADGKLVTLREVLVHMIEEYARHAGHADLLRERIDGRVGQ